MTTSENTTLKNPTEILARCVEYPDENVTLKFSVEAGRLVGTYVERMVKNGRFMGLTVEHDKTRGFITQTHFVVAKGEGRVLAEFIRSLPEGMV